MLVDRFGRGIAPAMNRWGTEYPFRILLERKIGVAAVYFRSGRKYDLDMVLMGQLQNVARPIDIALNDFERILHCIFHTEHGG
ncbi:hypothetical protein D3C77_509230 [compost metagenome]